LDGLTSNQRAWDYVDYRYNLYKHLCHISDQGIAWKCSLVI